MVRPRVNIKCWEFTERIREMFLSFVINNRKTIVDILL